jgi:integral membrane protein (TIGR01906 family)
VEEIMKEKILKLIVIILMPAVMLLTSLEIVVKSDSFFLEQYDINNVENATGMEIDELMRVTDEIQDFLFGKREDFNIKGTIDGVEQEIFNEREIIHMDDVGVLFDKGILFRNVAAMVLLFIGIYGISKRKWLYKSLILSAATYFVVLIALGGLLYLDFNRYFNLFHEIFFSNDYWILDPADSVLINMVPINFFMSIVKRILLTSSATMMGIAFLCGILLKREVKHEGNFNIRD